VIDVLRVLAAADRAHTTLLAHELVELVRTDAVAVFQVVVAASTMEALARLVGTRVVARLAIAVEPIF
jgi:hypothetical protein